VPQGIPLDNETRAAILDDIRAGQKSCRAIATDHNVSRTTVSKIAKDAGIVDAFGRQKTKEATAASVADAASRRAQLAEKLIKLAELSMDQAIAELGQASSRDAAVVLGIAIDKHRQLVDMDRDPEGLSAVDAWLRGITGQ
jgi:transposase-like protein